MEVLRGPSGGMSYLSTVRPGKLFIRAAFSSASLRSGLAPCRRIIDITQSTKPTQRVSLRRYNAASYLCSPVITCASMSMPTSLLHAPIIFLNNGPGLPSPIGVLLIFVHGAMQ